MKPDQPNPDVDAMQPQMPSSTGPLSEHGQRTLAPDTIPADTLFQGQQEIVIDHKGAHYRLRITKNGKLILTK